MEYKKIYKKGRKKLFDIIFNIFYYILKYLFFRLKNHFMKKRFIHTFSRSYRPVCPKNKSFQLY